MNGRRSRAKFGGFASLLVVLCPLAGCAWLKEDPLAAAQSAVTRAAFVYQTCMDRNHYVESMCPAEREAYEKAKAAFVAAASAK